MLSMGCLLMVIGSVKKEVYDHFKKIFTESMLVRPSFVSDKFKTISTYQVLALECAFSDNEIQQAVWCCEGFKALGPDDFSTNFVKKNLEFLKHDFVAAINEFGKTGQIPRGCNSTFLTLIPKVGDPQLVSDYRSINLVSLQYKIISKLLANCLKAMMPTIISYTRSAFIEGRQILDCILVANESVEWAKRSKSKLLLLKIDFAKTFDSVNWSFLDSIMRQMGFGEK